VSGRHTVTETDDEAETDRRRDAHTVAYAGTVAECVVCGEHTVAVALTAADGDTDADAGAGIAEPRPRDAGPDRFGSDDLRVGVDLASLPQLERRSSATAPNRDRMSRLSLPVDNSPLDRSERVTTITRT
jgi:hypothetical protein